MSGRRGGVPALCAIWAILFGIAEALILDELALLVNLQDVYWQSEEERSVIAVAAGGSVLLLIIFLRAFVLSVFRGHRKR